MLHLLCEQQLALVWMLIGSLPEYKELRRYSGTVVDYVVTSLYKSPGAFLEAARTGGWRLVSAELTEAAKPIVGFPWESKHYTVIIVGNEQVGIPNEILAHSEHIYIPMPGVGYCLNTSQTANILAYEATKCLSDNFGLCS